MPYRTKTYIAGDWTGDQNLISQLYKWNDSDHWALNFHDAHLVTQARDTSLYCSIKKSLIERLNISKTFVLVVGEKTAVLTKGGCQNCRNYSVYNKSCRAGGYVDYRSYITFECEKALRDNLRIIVLYNYASIRKEKCPQILQNCGQHLASYRIENGYQIWNYYAIKQAIMGEN